MSDDRVFFVPHVADPDAPTMAELEGVEITGFLASDGLTFGRPTPPPVADIERLLRERYAPLLSAEDYARLREKCGLGPVIDGEVSDSSMMFDQVDEAFDMGNAMRDRRRRDGAPLMICEGGEMVLVTDPASYFGWAKRDGQVDG